MYLQMAIIRFPIIEQWLQWCDIYTFSYKFFNILTQLVRVQVRAHHDPPRHLQEAAVQQDRGQVRVCAGQERRWDTLIVICHSHTQRYRRRHIIIVIYRDIGWDTNTGWNITVIEEPHLVSPWPAHSGGMPSHADDLRVIYKFSKSSKSSKSQEFNFDLLEITFNLTLTVDTWHLYDVEAYQ